MHKQGLGVGQVFMFIVMALTFALILLFGYKSIQDLLQSEEKVEFVQFKNDLESAVKRIYTEYGSVRVVNFYLPPKYEQICLVDMDFAPNNDNPLDKLCLNNSLACSVWEEASSGKGYAGVEENVFLKPTGPTPIKVYKIQLMEKDTAGNKIRKGFLCLDIDRGTFTLRLEGQGSYTEISIPETAVT